MTGCKTDEAREFSLRLCIANRYTKRELDRQIGSMPYERTMISHEKSMNIASFRWPAQIKALRWLLTGVLNII